ncbi:MAG: hypothetical protein SH847_06870 [Roseiflexaceae bacterium]|nr:hypothetical protein [Roseiflexaceae bacterium]
MMNPSSELISAQIVNRMQRKGVEVVESPFEREWQPGPFSRLVIALWRALRQIGERGTACATEQSDGEQVPIL